jgi:5-methylcytosine-specific restriction protein A
MTRPKRTCAESGCPTLVTKGYCLRHNRNRRLRESRESSSERTYDERWKKLRKIVLARDPICKICNKAPSKEVDHIIPRLPTQHAADVTEEELQGLCKPCHSKKTRAENAPKSKRKKRLGGVQNSDTSENLTVPTPRFSGVRDPDIRDPKTRTSDEEQDAGPCT